MIAAKPIQMRDLPVLSNKNPKKGEAKMATKLGIARKLLATFGL